MWADSRNPTYMIRIDSLRQIHGSPAMILCQETLDGSLDWYLQTDSLIVCMDSCVSVPVTIKLSIWGSFHWSSVMHSGVIAWRQFKQMQGEVMNIFSFVTIGNITLMAIAGLLTWYPGIFKSRHCNAFQDWAPINEIYRCPISKWVAEIWQHCRVPKKLPQLDLPSELAKWVVDTRHHFLCGGGGGGARGEVDNKPLPEPMLTLIPVAIWRH